MCLCCIYTRYYMDKPLDPKEVDMHTLACTDTDSYTATERHMQSKLHLFVSSKNLHLFYFNITRHTIKLNILLTMNLKMKHVSCQH